MPSLQKLSLFAILSVLALDTLTVGVAARPTRVHGKGLKKRECSRPSSTVSADASVLPTQIDDAYTTSTDAATDVALGGSSIIGGQLIQTSAVSVSSMFRS